MLLVEREKEELISRVASFIDRVYEEERVVKYICVEMASCMDIDDKSLDDMLENIEAGFKETLFRYIDEKGLDDVECYKRAGVDKKTFSKIRCNKNYKPSKDTVISFALALRLNLDETAHLLNTVGMSLSHSSKFDVIIEYFITTGDYKNILEVNDTLYRFGERIIGE